MLVIFYSQPLLHDGAGGGVLQKYSFIRVKVFLNTKSRQGSLVKTTEN